MIYKQKKIHYKDKVNNTEKDVNFCQKLKLKKKVNIFSCVKKDKNNLFSLIREKKDNLLSLINDTTQLIFITLLKKKLLTED